MLIRRWAPSSVDGMMPSSESAEIGWPSLNCVAGSISRAWRTLVGPAKSPRNQRPSQYEGHALGLSPAGLREKPPFIGARTPWTPSHGHERQICGDGAALLVG